MLQLRMMKKLHLTCFGGKCDLIYIYFANSINYIQENHYGPTITLAQEKRVSISVPASHGSHPASPSLYSNSALGAESSSTTPFKDKLMALLGIPKHLSNRTNRNLHFAYQKYKAYIQACQTLTKRISEGTWPGKRPSTTELIEIFLLKSMWFFHYKPVFSKVSNYPLMVEWLENEEAKVSDSEIWGVEKVNYMLTDLRKFVDNGGTLAEKAEKEVVKKSKGKKKAKDACFG